MKFILISILILTLISCKKEADISNLKMGKNNLVYESNQTTPFTGVALLKKNNKILTIWNYKNRKADGICKNYYENGNLKFYGEFKNGLPNGSLKEYNNSGILVIEENYLNGVLNGEKKEYYENGVLKNLETYKDNFLHGSRITYDSDSNIKIKELYIFDEVVNSNLWPNEKELNF